MILSYSKLAQWTRFGQCERWVASRPSCLLQRDAYDLDDVKKVSRVQEIKKHGTFQTD